VVWGRLQAFATIIGREWHVRREDGGAGGGRDAPRSSGGVGITGWRGGKVVPGMGADDVSLERAGMESNGAGGRRR